MQDKDELITIGAACRLLGGEESPVHPSTLHRWVKKGRISAPLKIGPATVRFSKRKLLAELGLQERAA